jgi:hypothetical protein
MGNGNTIPIDCTRPHVRTLCYANRQDEAGADGIGSGACSTGWLVTETGSVVPLLVAASGDDAAECFLNFFATQIENDNTRAAYLRAARSFSAGVPAKG